MLDRTRGDRADDRLQFVRELVAGDADVAADVAEIPGSTWAIHGVIPVDRDVLMATFDSYAQARNVLDELLRSARGTDSAPR